MLKFTVRVALIILLVIVSAVGSYAQISLLQTGQTICYSANGTIINCSGTGQDGEYQKGLSILDKDRFITNYDGTITDNLTGLTWISYNGVTSFRLPALKSTYADTKQKIKDFNENPDMFSRCVTKGKIPSALIGQYDDWRIPTINEIESLTNFGFPSFDKFLLSRGFSMVVGSWTTTPQPEWNTSHYFYSISSAYGGNAFGTWHNVSANGNTTDSNMQIMAVRGSSQILSDPADGVDNRIVQLDTNIYKDVFTGLIWTITNTSMTFEQALIMAKENNMRVPNVNELKSLFDYTNIKHSTFIPQKAYWTSTSNHNNGSQAWVVDFNTATIQSPVRNKSSNYYVILVTDETIESEVPVVDEVVELVSDNINGTFIVNTSEYDILVTSLGKDASYTHKLYIQIDNSPYQYLFNSDNVNTIVNLGKLPIGTIINFKLEVINTGYSYYTGLASNNPDNVDHCLIQPSDNNSVWIFGFEDLINGGDHDYNDCMFIVAGVKPTTNSEVVVK